MKGLVAVHGLRFDKDKRNRHDWYEETGNGNDFSKDTGSVVFGFKKAGMDLIDPKTLEIDMIFIKVPGIDVITANTLEMDMIAMKTLEI